MEGAIAFFFFHFKEILKKSLENPGVNYKSKPTSFFTFYRMEIAI